MTEGRLSVGIVTPHTAAGPEVEIPAMTRGRVTTVVHRTGSAAGMPQAASEPFQPAHAELRASVGPAALDRAAVNFGDRKLAALAHASTTSGYVIGHRQEADVVERLSQRFDVPAVASCAAAVAALLAHGIGQVQLVHPPWLGEEFDELGAAYFRGQGVDAVVTRAVGLPDDPALVETRHVVDWVERHVENGVEAVFLAGNGFRAAGAVEQLELRTGRLVVTANQALLWGLLAATDTRWDVTGYGRLLRTSPSTT